MLWKLCNPPPLVYLIMECVEDYVPPPPPPPPNEKKEEKKKCTGSSTFNFLKSLRYTSNWSFSLPLFFFSPIFLVPRLRIIWSYAYFANYACRTEKLYLMALLSYRLMVYFLHCIEKVKSHSLKEHINPHTGFELLIFKFNFASQTIIFFNVRSQNIRCNSSFYYFLEGKLFKKLSCCFNYKLVKYYK